MGNLKAFQKLQHWSKTFLDSGRKTSQTNGIYCTFHTDWLYEALELSRKMSVKNLLIFHLKPQQFAAHLLITEHPMRISVRFQRSGAFQVKRGSAELSLFFPVPRLFLLSADFNHLLAFKEKWEKGKGEECKISVNTTV